MNNYQQIPGAWLGASVVILALAGCGASPAGAPVSVPPAATACATATVNIAAPVSTTSEPGSVSLPVPEIRSTPDAATPDLDSVNPPETIPTSGTQVTGPQDGQTNPALPPSPASAPDGDGQPVGDAQSGGGEFSTTAPADQNGPQPSPPDLDTINPPEVVPTSDAAPPSSEGGETHPIEYETVSSPCT